ncbi:MAG TPA: DUF3320 domain-containing protein [Ilumatobacteraceae bacterium]|nr:DUF3320 domain-containing protein [Ilumatobacteraceae bacterium]
MTGLTKQQEAKLSAQLEKWRQDLVNLTKRNKALYFRHLKTASLEVVAPSMAQIFARLETSPWMFHLPPEDPDAGEDEPPQAAVTRSSTELLTTKKSSKELLAALRSLERTANQTLLDTGLSVLYLSFGMLKWIDPLDGKGHESPLLLQPVTLARPGRPNEFHLNEADDDPVINPSLTIKLASDFGITIPTIDEFDADPKSVVERVRSAVSKQKGWSVEERVILTTFTFHKDAMYRDLITNAAAVAAHPLVQLAAVGATAGAERFAFSPPDDDELDRVAPPEELVSIRDADSTQRKCIIAARDGRSFVMDGPPGTGKSQTITNVIAELLHAGRRVLFVSEKAAALDVVHNRLSEAGLAEFVLTLHSHKATRKDVATTLGRALEVSPRATARFKETDRTKLVQLRQELSDYAIAENVRRLPLQQSLHQVLGRILQLQHLPHAPVASTVDAHLTPEALGEHVGAAERLGRAWGPISRGDGFLWRSMRDSTVSVGRQQQVDGLLTTCDLAVDALCQQAAGLDDSLGLGWSTTMAGAQQLHHLTSLVESHPHRADLPVHWLTTSDIGDVAAVATERRAQSVSHSAASARAEQIAGTAWRLAPHNQHKPLLELLAQLGSMPVPLADPSELNSSSIASGLGTLSDLDAAIGTMGDDVARIQAGFGFPRSSPTIATCEELAELATFIGSPHPPEPAWLSPVVQASLQDATTVMSELLTDYRSRRESLRSTFTDGVLDLDLIPLQARLKANNGIKKLGSTYRADKALLVPFVVSGKVNAQVVQSLDAAIAWKQLSERLTAAEAMHSGLLGSYYQGRLETDLERVERAIHVAQRSMALCHGNPPPLLSQQIGVAATPGAEVLQAGVRLQTTLAGWHAGVAPALSDFAPNADALNIDELRPWAHATSERLASVAAILAATAQSSTVALTVGESVELLGSSQAAKEIERAVQQTGDADRALLGPTYEGLTSDFDQIHKDLAWARSIITATGTELTETAAADLLVMASTADHLGMSLSAATKAWVSVADLFQQPWRDQLSKDFFVSFDDGRALLSELHDTSGDIDEWCRYATSRQELVDAGFEQVVTFAEEQSVEFGDVSKVVERSILESWADSVISGDSRLKTLAPSERNNVVEQFRDLDRALVANAAARVINECAKQRPSTALGAAGIIRREAQKKTRHKPIRTLLAETREVALALKPCFMMSPLSVSQFLPPDIGFDVVIFDEASQVRPADAVNCIYRGKQIIVAGDPRQLPPTNFFEQVTEESADEFDEEAPEDFESVLDIYLGSGLPPLSLQWHYRSQHEALITYSNYKFYGGRLHTFPGAIETADDVGVELFFAGGTYRRGGARDNPVEAAAVVDRVLFHRRNDPNMTLGVVAFSSAQESAILAEIERRSAKEPELPELLTDDRLDGFFVKNLENVQGDERDIIIFSIGYGPDEHGKFTEQLGPLGQKGGERRLNVAITRARRRLEVVTSVRAADFPGTSMAEGIRHLQRYLDFAARGVSALALEVNPTNGDAESPFEEAVLSYIASLGFDAVPQVGVAGYRIDMGVRHPTRPGEFAIGIECDGAAYHSSTVARDRDRLRQDILEGLGWTLHRIWGPSWYRDRRGQEQILKAAIEAAFEGQRQSRASKPKKADTPVIEIDTVDLDEPPAWTVPYQLSHWRPAHRFVDILSLPTAELAVGIEVICATEGQIHGDLLRRRVCESFDLQRMGSRIKEAIDAAITTALKRRSVLHGDAGFLRAISYDPLVRVPTSDERTNRIVAHVAPAERQAAIQHLVRDSQRVELDDLRVAFGRLFGWKRIGADIEAAFDRDVRQLVKDGEIALDGHRHVIDVK